MNQVSRQATLFVVCTAHFLMPFMMSAVGVALPSIGREFGASAQQLGLIETTYVLSATIFLLPMGRLGDIYGRRRIFLLGVILFTAVSALLSLAWSIEAFIALRFLQGMGGSMVMSTSLAMVVSVFPPQERGRALGITVACVYAGISCGPFLGGMLVSSVGWRTIFYLSVPLGLLTLVVTLLRLHGEWADAAGEPFDWQGSMVYALALLLLIAGASNLDHGAWGWGLAAAGTGLLLLFLRIEVQTPFPVLNLTLLRENRVFALSSLAALFNYAATFGVTFFMSLYLQEIKGMSARQAGLILMIQPLLQTFLSPWCGRLADRYPAARVATTGMALCAVGLAGAATLGKASPLPVVAGLLALLGIGFALFSSPNVSILMGSVAPRFLGVASGLNSTMRTMGMMASMTIVTIIFSIVMAGRSIDAASHAAFLASMHSALLIFSALCVIGIFCSAARTRA